MSRQLNRSNSDKEFILVPTLDPATKSSNSKKSSMGGMEKAMQDSLGIDAMKEAIGVKKGDNVYTHYYGDGVVRSVSKILSIRNSKNIYFR